MSGSTDDHSSAVMPSCRASMSMQRGVRLLAKRCIDLTVAMGTLTVFSPLIAVVGALVWISMGRPVFFKQQRPGRYGLPFTLYKFTTMSQGRDAAGNLLADEVRLTRTGRLIRSLSLDEIPQFWNVLRGEMSLVGPRPLLMEYLDRYSPEQARRHEVLPGITGWAQVNGRNALAWEAKFRLDVWYVDHWSLWLDAKILWLTLLKVIQRDGISHAGHTTMAEFTGSERK